MPARLRRSSPRAGGPRPVGVAGALAAAIACLAGPPARADGPWSRVDDKQGVLVERRVVPGSSYPELRATGTSKLPPAQLFAAVISPRYDDPKSRKVVKRYDVLREGPGERVVYEQIKTPVVSDRDYTIRLEWRADPGRGVWRLDFRIDNDAGPPPARGFVRMTEIRGHWQLEAAPDGGTRLEYVLYNEPGGSVPAFLVRGAQMDSARQSVLDAIAYAESHPLK